MGLVRNPVMFDAAINKCEACKASLSKRSSTTDSKHILTKTLQQAQQAHKRSNACPDAILGKDRDEQRRACISAPITAAAHAAVVPALRWRRYRLYSPAWRPARPLPHLGVHSAHDLYEFRQPCKTLC